MKINKLLFVAVCISFLGLTIGCTGSQQKRQPINFYNLSYSFPPQVQKKTLPFIISIEKFQAAPPYHSAQIIYSKNDFIRNKYFYHKWIASPGEMVTSLIGRDLQNANIVHAVFISNQQEATHCIKGTVDQFYERDTEDSWNAVLSITITLLKEKENDLSKRVIFQKNYNATHRCDKKNPNALADAMSKAMSKISEMILSDVYVSLTQ